MCDDMSSRTNRQITPLIMPSYAKEQRWLLLDGTKLGVLS